HEQGQAQKKGGEPRPQRAGRPVAVVNRWTGPQKKGGEPRPQRAGRPVAVVNRWTGPKRKAVNPAPSGPEGPWRW
ncbi:MAG: hypothetical protein OEW12_01265, partial [Deltaproteobacteria bacterium]|nr:hypothetical protein [Deltaproteobacteria bacterium]